MRVYASIHEYWGGGSLQTRQHSPRGLLFNISSLQQCFKAQGRIFQSTSVKFPSVKFSNKCPLHILHPLLSSSSNYENQSVPNKAHLEMVDAIALCFQRGFILFKRFLRRKGLIHPSRIHNCPKGERLQSFVWIPSSPAFSHFGALYRLFGYRAIKCENSGSGILKRFP